LSSDSTRAPAIFTPPEKTWQGKLTVRLDDDLRRRLAIIAAASGESVKTWIMAVLDRETKRALAGAGLAAEG
jgi:predicted HicB family RNase H-like nuclease